MSDPAEPPGEQFQIVKSFPPNIAAIRAKFPFVAGRRGLLFTYGLSIHNPDGVEIENHLIRHEIVHVLQQREVGGPEKWWELYLSDQDFRLRQEMTAHVAEYQSFCAGPPPRNRRARYAHLDTIAERLSSGIYGYMIRRQAAKAAILRGVSEFERSI
jgi:hypothetical protein